MNIELTPDIQKRIRAFRKKARKHYLEFVEQHINEKCTFARCKEWSQCSVCNGFYYDHNSQCRDWKWLWTLSVGPHDDRL